MGLAIVSVCKSGIIMAIKGGADEMKQSNETDKICIEKIIKYIGDIQTCFNHFNITTYSEFENQRLAQLAITQSITNIYETKKYLQQATLYNIPDFDKIKIGVARNIASHDYESINFETIYRICTKLLSSHIKEVLEDGYDKLG